MMRRKPKGFQEGAFCTRGVTQALRESALIVRSYPSTLLWPLFVMGIILGFGIWGVTRMVDLEEISAKERAQNLALDAATWLRSLILSTATPCQLIAAMVSNSPQYPDARNTFRSLAPFLLGQELYNCTKRINLLPNGVIEETYPPTEDNKRALGFDVFTLSPTEAMEVMKAVQDNATTLAGPLALAEGGYGLVIRTPVFVSGVDANESFQSPTQLNPLCGAPCDYNFTDRTKFWGFVTSVVNFHVLTEHGDSRLQSFEKLGYRYEVKPLGMTVENMTSIAGSTVPPSSPVEAVVEMPNNEWVIRVSPTDGWRPSYYPGLVAGVVVVAIAVSWLVFVVLLSRRRHQMLLEALLPKKIIENLDAAALSSHRHHEPDTPANTLLDMMGLLLEGRMPKLHDVLFIRTALLRNMDVYQPINIKGHIKGGNLDAEVERALMQQLVGGSVDSRSGARPDGDAASPDGGSPERAPLDRVQAACQAAQFAVASYDLDSTAGTVAFVLSTDAAPRPFRTLSSKHLQAAGSAVSMGAAAHASSNGGGGRDASPSAPPFLLPVRVGSSPLLTLQHLASPFRFPMPGSATKSRLKAKTGGTSDHPVEKPPRCAAAVGVGADSGALEDDGDCTMTTCDDVAEDPSLMPPIAMLTHLSKRRPTSIWSRGGSRTVAAPVDAESLPEADAHPEADTALSCREEPKQRHSMTVHRPLSACEPLKPGAASSGSKLVHLVFGRRSMECTPSMDGSTAATALQGQFSRLGSRSSAVLPRGFGGDPHAAGAGDANTQGGVHGDAAELPPVPRPSVNMPQVERLLTISDAWQFDTWALSEATQGHALSTLAFFLIKRSGLIEHFHLNPVRLARFLRQVEAGYLGNPYHNAVHAADVLQTLHVVIHAAQLHVHYLDKLGLLAAYIAAVVHDYGHPGLTGDFLIACSHPLAILYNDRSPLENHHCAASFNLMQRPDLDVLAPLPAPERATFRKQVIDLVLATDMKQHFSILSHFNTVHRLSNYTSQKPGNSSTGSLSKLAPGGRLQNVQAEYNELVNSSTLASTSGGTDTAPKPVDDTERLLSLQVALKCADIGHLGEALEVHQRWLSSLEEEFFSQGDRERDLGLPISPLFDRSKQGVSKSQVGFYEFVALPLVHAMTSAFPGAQPLMRCLLDNYHHWRRAARGALPDRSPTGSTVLKE